jgi:hypothetical protein
MCCALVSNAGAPRMSSLLIHKYLSVAHKNTGQAHTQHTNTHTRARTHTEPGRFADVERCFHLPLSGRVSASGKHKAKVGREKRRQRYLLAQHRGKRLGQLCALLEPARQVKDKDVRHVRGCSVVWRGQSSWKRLERRPRSMLQEPAWSVLLEVGFGIEEQR